MRIIRDRSTGHPAFLPALIMMAAAVVAPPSILAQELIDLPGTDRAIRADFEEVFRVGSFDGDVWETFGDIAGVSFDAAGNLYVLDRQANQITVIDSQGQFVRTIGQPGEGPGEFRMAMGFTAMPDGQVVVADLGHRAFQMFDADGAFDRMVSMSMDGGTLRLGPIQPHPSGTSVLSGGSGGGVVSMRGGGPGGAAAPEPTGRPIELVSLEGDAAVATTIVTAWAPPPGEPETMEGGGVSIRMGAMPRTFEPDLFVGALPDGGVVYSDSAAYVINVVGADGQAERVVRRPFRAERLTERMQDAERERRLAELEEGEGPQVRMMVSGPGGGPQAMNQEAIKAMMQGRIEQMQFYHELPVLMGLKTSWSGKIWAQRRGDSPTEPGAIDVITSAGQYVGTYPAGETSVPSAFGPGGLAAYIEADEFEVPVVVVRRLPGIVN